MKLVVGYDRDMAAQCFRRNLTQIVRPGTSSLSRITPEEVDYFAERMAETSVFGYYQKFGSPWVFLDDADELVKLSVKKTTRRALQRCELLANNFLILEGVVGRAGASLNLDPDQLKLLKKRILMAGVLYNKASNGEFYSTSQRDVLFRMSRHVFDWVRYLSILPGNDYMDLLTTTTEPRTHRIQLS